MILLLFGRDSLSLVRSTILIFSFRARLYTHGRFPLSLGLLNPCFLITRVACRCQTGSDQLCEGLSYIH